ncbi:Cyclic AMP-dependent transcription factor ATF-7 [Haplosporangium sp. Z 11]|nr:Cyclic AMP-dependent transcription factor ATF-7 [Haplosporangium sp. Z 11]
MSLETDIRRDVNPTPTRFLLECGAFTPGFGLSFDNLNPFDASLKFLNTGTPKAEMNPFDSSFRTPSSAISISNNNVTSTPHQQAQHQHIERERSGDRHPWADMIFGGDTMPMPQPSPVEMHHIHNEYRADGPQQDLEDDDQNSMDVDSDNDTAMSVSSFKEPSSASRPRMTTRASSRNASQTNGAKNTEAPSKTTAAAANTSIATPVRKPRGRKRAADNESPEDKRQKFLERNRLAASKCREKKRLATLKIISDADEITTRNQTLHETLRVLQEEVRQLKNQILCHRDCGCDVIQKFVQSTSFDSGASPVSSLPVPSHVQQMRFFETEL